MLETEEIKEYLGIDYSDPMTEHRLKNLKKVAAQYLDGAIGEYAETDERAKELMLIIISDLFDNRELNEKVNYNTRKLVQDFILQLQCESQKKKRKENDISETN